MVTLFSAYMVLNFKEECRCTPFTIKRLLEPFNPIMNFTLIFLYLIMEVTFVGIDFENKICYLGHLVGLLSGFVVGFIVLDNKVRDIVRMGRWVQLHPSIGERSHFTQRFSLKTRIER